MKTVTYNLTGSEMHLAVMAGVQRAIDAIRSNRQRRYGSDGGPCWDHNINGCVGELTTAKHFGCFWNGSFRDLGAVDVGERYQVRASDYDGPNAGLILHPPDRDDQIFIKALVKLPQVTLMGWLLGCEAKQPQFWTDKLKPGRPCFLVPHEMLHGMDELAPQDREAIEEMMEFAREALN
jgi:hypothetical protein